MNAKKCKKLRRLVRQRMNQDQPPCEYEVVNKSGHIGHTGTLRVSLRSKRGFYLNLKKWAKKGKGFKNL